MKRDAIEAAFAGLRKLVDLGRFMDKLRPAGSAPDPVAARELTDAGRSKAQALVKKLQAAPPPYAAWATALGEELELAVSSSREDDPRGACDRAEALLAEIEASLERDRQR
jgi:hypothetical protein